MRLSPLLAGFALFAGTSAGGNPASSPLPAARPQVVCTTIARPALAVTVKNERGQVLAQLTDMDGGNNPWITMRREADGRYTVTVKRRWYQPQTLRHIPVQYDRCGPVRPTPMTIRLQPTPDAPTIREFRILNVNPDNLTVVGSWPYFRRYIAFLDAPGRVSREVIWTSSRPDVATVDPTGMLRSVCSREVGRTTITATLKADPRFKSSTVFGRGGGGTVCPRGEVDR